MNKVREDAEVITRGLDDILYYDPVMLEEQANEYERKIAREEGFNEGKEAGIKEGEDNKQKENVQRMISKNLSLEQISEYLGLDIEEVKSYSKL